MTYFANVIDTLSIIESVCAHGACRGGGGGYLIVIANTVSVHVDTGIASAHNVSLTSRADVLLCR